MTSIVGRLVTLILALAAFAGCASSQEAGAGPSNLPIASEDARALGYVAQWATEVPFSRRGTVSHAKVLGDVVVIVERPTQIVTALSMRDGKVLWRRAPGVGGGELFPPARAGDLILYNTSNRLWQARARDGEVLRVQDLGRVVSTGAVVFDDDYAIFGSIDGTVFSHTLEDGIVTWRYGMTNKVVAQPVVVGDNVFTADASGAYAMLTGENENHVWRGRTFAGIQAEPALDRTNLYVPSLDGSLYALDRARGRDQWTYRTETPLALPPKAMGLTVLLPVPDEGVVALDAPTGQVRWELDGVKALVVAQQDNDAILGGSDRLLRVSLDDGRVRTEVPTKRLAAVRAGEDGSLILVTPQGRVLRLNPTR